MVISMVKMDMPPSRRRSLVSEGEARAAAAPAGSTTWRAKDREQEAIRDAGRHPGQDYCLRLTDFGGASSRSPHAVVRFESG